MKKDVICFHLMQNNSPELISISYYSDFQSCGRNSSSKEQTQFHGISGRVDEYSHDSESVEQPKEFQEHKIPGATKNHSSDDLYSGCVERVLNSKMGESIATSMLFRSFELEY